MKPEVDLGYTHTTHTNTPTTQTHIPHTQTHPPQYTYTKTRQQESEEEILLVKPPKHSPYFSKGKVWRGWYGAIGGSFPCLTDFLVHRLVL